MSSSYIPQPPEEQPQGSLQPYSQPDNSGYQGQAYGQQAYGYQGQSYAQPYGQQYGQAYGQPYGQPTGYYQQPGTNGMAIGSLVSSLVGFVLGWAFSPLFLGMLVGIVLGHISLSQIKKTGEQGRGLAIGGLICGYLGTAIFVLLMLGFLAIFGVLIGFGAFAGS